MQVGLAGATDIAADHDCIRRNGVIRRGRVHGEECEEEANESHDLLPYDTPTLGFGN
jgi:hypothetical protein